MSRVHAVLLVPAEGDPHRLLREGPCGARPPIVHEAHKQSAFGPNTTVWTTSEATVYTSKKQAPYMPHRRALALAWDGEPVAEGLDRLARCLGWEPPGDGIDVEEMLNLWLSGLRTKTGTLVLLDAKGREVSDG